MAATEKKNPWRLSSSGNTIERVITRKIAASQGIYMAGAPFYLSTSGTVKICDTADGTDALHYWTSAGVAAQLDANTEIKVRVIRDDILYCVFIENNTADAAESAAYKGNQYGMTVSTTAGQIGYTTMDVNNANGIFFVEDMLSELEPHKAPSTAPGIAVVTVLPTIIDNTKA